MGSPSYSQYPPTFRNTRIAHYRFSIDLPEQITGEKWRWAAGKAYGRSAYSVSIMRQYEPPIKEKLGFRKIRVFENQVLKSRAKFEAIWCWLKLVNHQLDKSLFQEILAFDDWFLKTLSTIVKCYKARKALVLCHCWGARLPGPLVRWVWGHLRCWPSRFCPKCALCVLF